MISQGQIILITNKKILINWQMHYKNVVTL
jgi:hypothetical protein